ncbi:precorrin-3B synthase [Phytoactinopolyspora alkaliphila]|uniref:Precorrin-3B synthase n=1 Tax=Phytoactinopolyspora alkaliphila TaxID=1783498 RepID=A0A6N9YKZ3_9ACTN|nr:precorrin-3B synthase [Phytoactinopolyspora alkaliphila]NED95549.1 precorrin-3B synthase [Phytoactinopolyspora alkaliphila]
MARVVRNRADACPGTLTTHLAADGPLARVRVPGGRITTEQLGVLAHWSEQLGDGSLHLTSRANVQLRGVADPAKLAERLAAAGMLPSPAHERVRNILASPLSGVAGGIIDIRPIIAALDDAVCREPRLAELSGRFQFGLDDGRGDLRPEALDLGWRALGENVGALLAAGVDTGLRVQPHQAASVMTEAALVFLDSRETVSGDAWHLHELADGPRMLADTLAARLGGAVARTAPTAAFPQGAPPAVGVWPHDAEPAWAAVAGTVLGTLTAEQLRTLAQLAPRPVLITPWRSVILPGLSTSGARSAPEALTAAGLVVDPADRSLGVSACIGLPGCASSASDVRADTRRLIPLLPPGAAIHVSGCARRCGRPRTPHVDVVATTEGYAVDNAVVAADHLAAAIAEAGNARADPAATPSPGKE